MQRSLYVCTYSSGDRVPYILDGIVLHSMSLQQIPFVGPRSHVEGIQMC